MNNKHRKAYITVSILVVAIFSILMLKNMFSDVPTYHKVLIVISATLFSGVIAKFLFPQEPPEEVDPKPEIHNKNR